MGSSRDRDNLARFGITAKQGVRRVDGQHPGAGQAARAQSRARRRRCGRPAGTRRACWRRSSTSRRGSRRRRWTAGAATSTTGPSATPSAFTCSTARRTRGPRSTQWRDQRDEFVKRAAFALLASLRCTTRAPAIEPFVETPAADRARRGRRPELRQEGRELGAAAIGRRNRALNAQALAVARRLSASEAAAARWIGKGALKELSSPLVSAPARDTRRWKMTAMDQVAARVRARGKDDPPGSCRSTCGCSTYPSLARTVRPRTSRAEPPRTGDYSALNSLTGRTSMLPVRAGGILPATWMASLRSRASTR